MENTKIKCTIDNIKKLQKIVEENNNIILDSLKEIDAEYSNISNVLSTPKSTEVMPKCVDYVKNQEKFVIENDTYFQNVFNTIISEYSSFMSETEKSVGGE